MPKAAGLAVPYPEEVLESEAHQPEVGKDRRVISAERTKFHLSVPVQTDIALEHRWQGFPRGASEASANLRYLQWLHR